MSFSASPLAAWFSFIIVTWLMLSASNKPMKKKAVEVRGYHVSLHMYKTFGQKDINNIKNRI